MSLKEHEIVVVGGGPAGLLSAKASAELGKDVLLLESKDKIGQYEHCAGLLSLEGLSKLGLANLPKDVVQNNSITGARLYSPSGKMIDVSKNSTTACVVDRAKFNMHLSALAEKKGVKIHTSSKVKSISRKEDSLILKLGKQKSFSSLISRIVILAEGRFPSLNQQLGLSVPPRDKIVFTSMYIMSGVDDINPKLVELYQAKKYAPGFFSWIIPIDKTSAKVGLGSRYRPAFEYLDDFIKKHPVAKGKLENAKVEQRMSGAIPLGAFIRKTYTKGALVIGDAASQTKPTTGGGVILGGIAAQIAGKVASEAIEENDVSAKFLSKYEKYWRKELKRNLTMMKHVRFYLDSLSNKEVETLFSLVEDPKINDLISEFGDVDNQKAIIYRMIFQFKLWPFLIRTGLKYLFKK